MTVPECLLFYVKWPEPGRVKTRLAADIGDHHAAALYRCFVLDMLETFSVNPRPVYICYTPKDAGSGFKQWLGRDWHFLPQTGSGLGEKMRNSFEQAFKLGFQSVCLVGSDLPALRPVYLDTAFTYLHHYDSVIGPAHDGGYYLLGFRKKSFFPEIFKDIPWSQSTVYQETVLKYTRQGASFYKLPPWSDMDNLHDLYRWYRCRHENKRFAPRTCAYIRDLFRMRVLSYF